MQCNVGGSGGLDSNDGGQTFGEAREYNVVFCYNHGGAQPRGKIYVDGVVGQEMGDTEKALRIHTFSQTVFLFILTVFLLALLVFSPSGM